MTRSRATRQLIVAVALVLGTVACAGSTDRAGGAVPDRPVLLRVLDTRAALQVGPYAEALRALSGGVIRLDVTEKFERHSLRGEPDAIRAVRSGRTDLAVVPARAFHGVGVSSFDALIAPLAVDSMAMQQRVLGSDLPVKMLAGVRRLGLVGVAVLPGPMRKPVGISRDLLGPQTYRGARIAESPGLVGDRSLRALGALPVASPFEGADLSGFDGLEQQVGSIDGNGYDASARSITANVDLWPRPLVVVANRAAFSRLSARQGRWLRAAARASLTSSVQAQLRGDTDATATLCRRGLIQWRTATSAQVRDLRDAVAPVYSWLRQDAETGAYLDAIAALRGPGAGPDPLPAERLTCPTLATTAVATSPPPAATAFDGTYRMVSTKKQMLAYDPNVDPGNWGTFVYIFWRGRFAFTQENAITCGWGYGTYTVHRHRTTWRFDGGGTTTPGGTANKPGELVVFGWSRYRGTVTLSALPGVSPSNFFSAPWRPLSARAAPRYLSRRCGPPASAVPR
jgi:TRAP-type transport system periplasmic protein